MNQTKCSSCDDDEDCVHVAILAPVCPLMHTPCWRPLKTNTLEFSRAKVLNANDLLHVLKTGALQ